MFSKFLGPFLCKGMTLAIFQSSGNYPCSFNRTIDVLVFKFGITGAASLRTLAGILSTSVALETTNSLNNFKTFE